MKIKFRGGPWHNKYEEIRTLSYEYIFNYMLPIKFNVEAFYSDDPTVIPETVVHSRRHRYQLGRDEKGRQVYFHTGCV